MTIVGSLIGLAVLFGVGGLVFAGIVFVQICLSKSESKWLGLIFPGISFLFSLIGPLNVMATGDIWRTVGTIAVIFFIMNIPTVILMGLYTFCRKKLRKNAQLKKMEIQDLG